MRQTLAFNCEKSGFLDQDDIELIDFSSNDVLGLRHHAKIKKAWCKGINDYGVSSCASPVVVGTHPARLEVESLFADWLGFESGLLFSSGYAANLGVLQTLKTIEGVEVFVDKQVHASIYDGLQLSGLSFKRYPHLHLDQLESLLKASSAKRKVIISEGVFSMSGAITSVAKLQELKEKYNAKLVIDDAHSVGVVGDKGRGSVDLVKDNLIDVLITPLGKAFCSFGAMVFSSKDYVQTMKQKARSLIYSTAPPPAHAMALKTVLSVIQISDKQRMLLYRNIEFFCQKAKSYNLPFLMNASPIQFLSLGGENLAANMFLKLKQAGFHTALIRPPTVVKSQTGLRLVIKSVHQKKQIEKLLHEMKKFYEHWHTETR